MVKWRTCDTCEGEGTVMTMVPGLTGEPVEDEVDCPDCEFGEYAVAERWDWVRDSRVGRRYTRFVTRVHLARRLWLDRKADTIAAVITAHKGVLLDEPRMRALIDNDLSEQLLEATPLYWRLADARWALRNARLALRGRRPETPPWEERTDVRMSTENRDLFERNAVAIIAERRRVPRA